MKSAFVKYACFFLAANFYGNSLGFIRGRSFFLPRSQGVNAARELVGWQEMINLFTADYCYGSFCLVGSYEQTFSPKAIAEYFFGDSCIRFSGSRVLGRKQNDVLADYLGLPTDFESTVCFEPHARNAIIDFNWYQGLDPWYPGTYFRVHVPFVHTRWCMDLCESIRQSGCEAHPTGYMSSDKITRDQLGENVTQWFTGGMPFGDVQPLSCGLIGCCAEKFGVADVHLAFGWNMVNSPDYHFGVNFRIVAPTGTRSTGDILFEPVIGNGRHWELGLGVTGHTVLWDSMDAQKMISLYGDLNVSHLLASNQQRVFDFKHNGPSNRYILIETIGEPTTPGLRVDDQPVECQYLQTVLPAVNATKLCAGVSIGLQVDFVLKFSIACKDLTLDIGYKGWGRTAENLCCRQRFPEDCFAVKGDAQLYGFNECDESFPLNATQSTATIHAGQGEGNANKKFANENADDEAIATFLGPQCGSDEPEEMDLLQIKSTQQCCFEQCEVNGSKESIKLGDCDIDGLSALAPAAFTHGVFVHANYVWEDCCYLVPYVGAGGFVEWDGGGSQRNSAFNMWGVWLKGGIAY